MVLEGRVLVVVGGRARDSETSRCDRQLMGAVRQGELEPAPARMPLQCAQATGEREGLAEARTAAVLTDQGRLNPVSLEQLQRLRVVPGRNLDLVAALPEQRDQGPEDQHVRRGG